MSRENEERLVARVLEVSRSAVIGTAGTAAAQSVLAMIAFAVVGLEWLFWGIMLGFASLIPVVGTALIWIPAVIYAIGYMRILDEHAQPRFYAMFALSIFSAVSISLSANLITYYIFYEALTFATYWLVAHHQDAKTFAAARKYLTYLIR